IREKNMKGFTHGCERPYIGRVQPIKIARCNHSEKLRATERSGKSNQAPQSGQLVVTVLVTEVHTTGALNAGTRTNTG
ncbi:hypothetical protein, partial [Pseudomonas viridiflava]|uniref:hypothetical protein n=1 Tax=Pseudomonas viridiflava TaxID=33069 RepID=UPI0019CFA9ED